ncbi:MAG: hypothetical protein J7L73_04885 [Anaerolineales bacterium]|nr:hypothetical protein [Anaerolineales bacterium]
MHSTKLKPAIVCLAAGKSQLIVIKKAKELGFAVLAIDRNPDAPGFSFSDERIVLSTYEAKPIIRQLHALQDRYQLSGVINRSSGIPVVTAAEICQEFALPGISPASARIIIDKSQLMKACKTYGIAAPICQSVSSLTEINRPCLRFPCVVKPALSIVGKSGVRIVQDANALPAAFTVAKAVAMNGIVNIEELMQGRDVSLMSVVQRGQLCPITLLDELNVADSKGNIKGAGFAVPSVFSGQTEETRIINLARQIVDSFKLDTTSFNMSCRCESGGEPRLIEIHLDLGGDLVLDALLPGSTSFDVLSFTILSLVGGNPPCKNINFIPSAVIFSKGEGLVSERPYEIISEPDRISLEQTIISTQRKIYG